MGEHSQHSHVVVARLMGRFDGPLQLDRRVVWPSVGCRPSRNRPRGTAPQQTYRSFGLYLEWAPLSHGVVRLRITGLAGGERDDRRFAVRPDLTEER